MHSCIILCGGWPSWALLASSRNLHISVLLTKSSRWLPLLHALFPTVNIVLWSSVSLASFSWPYVTYTFTDFDLSSSLLRPVWRVTSHLILSSKFLRTIEAPWSPQHVDLSHSSCGGPTDGAWRFHFYTPTPLPPLLLPSAGRTLSSFLSTKGGEGTACKPFNGSKPTTLSVIEVSPNMFHASGILPWTSRNPKVFCNDVFSPTGWCNRYLTRQEKLRILDIPSQVVEFLSQRDADELWQDRTMIPVNCLLSLFDTLSPMLGVPTEVSPPKVSQGNLPLGSAPERGDRPGVPPPLEPLPIPAWDLRESLPELPLASPAFNPTLVHIEEVERCKVATKSDDAEVPVQIWDDRIALPSGPAKRHLLTLLRTCALAWWKRHTTVSFLTWFKLEHGQPIDLTRILSHPLQRVDWEAGRDCVRRCSLSSWWDWEGGSRPLFWRWPKEYRKQIRDGIDLWIIQQLPCYRKPQRPEQDEQLRDAMTAKLSKVRKRGYISPGPVLSLTSYFCVPKGSEDIRMVYDGTKCGLNDQLWAPWFALPTIDDHLRGVVPGTYMSDLDVSEQFLNFMLSPRVRPYAGVDLTPHFPEEISSRRRVLWERWERCYMGCSTSPYQAGQAMLFAEEFIRGTPVDPSNIFRFDSVRLNLPGDPHYMPNLPWVSKIRASDGQLACDLFMYVDDGRTTAPTYEECWGASRCVASKLNWLGVQDAARKRRPPSQEPGAWSGSVVFSSHDNVLVLVSQERWDKARLVVEWLQQALGNPTKIERKTLERHRGFLVYLGRTYPAIVPYLKGLHLTLDSWRPWRKSDGWKMSNAEVAAALSAHGYHPPQPLSAPEFVSAVPELQPHVEALATLLSSPHPPLRQVRPSGSCVVAYGFGDASGQGFGQTIDYEDGLLYSHGQWRHDLSSDRSSNFKELYNLVLMLEEAAAAGRFANTELFLLTDNSTAEAAFYKGTSSNPLLFGLILRLRKLQMATGAFFHILLVSGRRMIAQGTDGLSRGSICEGVLGGTAMLEFLPFHQSALDRSPTLQAWIESWTSTDGLPTLFLSPIDWYTAGHTASRAIWTPPPAAADAALAELAKAIHKRPHHSHIIVIPRLMTSRWRRLFGKLCDLQFTIPLGCPFWTHSQFEPLVVGVVFPFIRHRPWRLRGTPFMDRLARQLSTMPPSDHSWGGHILCQLFQQTRGFNSMSASLVWQVLHSTG